MNILVALILILLGCAAGTFIALSILAMASLDEDDQ